jgi:hypothetical protein
MGSNQEEHHMLSFLKAGRIATLAALALFAAAEAATAESGEELLEANITAIGGEEAIDAVKTIHRKGDVFVDGQFGVMEGTYERIAIIGQKAYNMRDLGVFVQAMGFDGERGWKDDAMMGIVDIEGGELEQIRAELVISPLVGIKAEGAAGDLSAAGTEEVDGIAYNVLELAREGQPTVRFYLDPETNLLARTQLDQDSPQWGPITIVLEFSDYQEHGGVLLPSVEKIDLGDFIRLETTYTETVINGEVDESIFDKPQPPAPPAAPAAATTTTEDAGTTEAE